MKNNKFNRISLLLMVAMLVMLLAVPVCAAENVSEECVPVETVPVMHDECNLESPEDEDDHDHEVQPCVNHEWSEWRVVVEPTGEHEGMIERVCNVCGEHEIETVPALGISDEPDHNEQPPMEEEEPEPNDGTAFKAPDEVLPRCAWYDIGRGRHVYLNHVLDVVYNWEDVIFGKTIRVAYLCKCCGDIQEEVAECRIGGLYGMDRGGVVYLEHAVDVFYSKPDLACEEAGYVTYLCECCGEVQEEYVEALGHLWSSLNVAEEHECEDCGKVIRKCHYCGDHRHESWFSYIWYRIDRVLFFVY